MAVEVPGCYQGYLAATGGTWVLPRVLECHWRYLDAIKSTCMRLEVPGCYEGFLGVTGGTWVLSRVHGGPFRYLDVIKGI